MNKTGDDLRPRRRTALRLFSGKLCYTARRYLRWFMLWRRFATKKAPPLSCVQFSHRTPLLRKLKDVDMYLQHNKITNLRLAAERLDGIVVEPGQVFSFWRLVGKPTKAKGYAPGMVLFCGTVRAGTGGGLCQLSNLIYWMTLHTPLKVKERYRHSFDVFPDDNRTQPFGSGATCVYNYRDLMIENGTDRPFQLCVGLADGCLCGEWRSTDKPELSYSVYETGHRIRLEPWGGYTRHNELRRKVSDASGRTVGDEYVTENHAVMMYRPFLESAKAPDTAG